MEAEEIVEAAEEAAASEVAVAVLRPSTDPTLSVLLERRDFVVWWAMRLCMPQYLTSTCLAMSRIFCRAQLETERTKECFGCGLCSWLQPQCRYQGRGE